MRIKTNKGESQKGKCPVKSDLSSGVSGIFRQMVCYEILTGNILRWVIIFSGRPPKGTLVRSYLSATNQQYNLFSVLFF
jgi:hypothetical protein